MELAIGIEGELHSAGWVQRMNLALARRSQIHDAQMLVCRRADRPYDQPGRAFVKEGAADHLERA